jgi:hypothetical protein
MSKASTDDMNALHGLVARQLRDILENGVEVVVDGEIQRIPAPAAFMAQAIKFLKDNNISSAAGEADMNELQKTLADLGAIPLDNEVPEEFQH